MDREHYISEAERQLNDSNFYTPLEHDPTLEYAKQVSDVVGEMLTEGLISEKNFNYLLVDQPKAGRFYLLPKIHKAGNPGRPIVSANGHPRKRSRSMWICICNPMSKIQRPTYRILQIFEETRCPWSVAPRHPPGLHGCNFVLHQHTTPRWYPSL